MEYLRMKTTEEDATATNTIMVRDDWKDIKVAAHKLATDIVKLAGLGFGTSFFQWLAVISAMSPPSLSLSLSLPLFVPFILLTNDCLIFSSLLVQYNLGLPRPSHLLLLAGSYLLVLDKTNWKTNILTALLVPYIFFSLPSLLFSILRGQIGMWIAFVTVVLRLFFPLRFPDWLELPGSVILIIVVAPDLIADTIRENWIGAAVCLVIACYLLQEHIRAS